MLDTNAFAQQGWSVVLQASNFWLWLILAAGIVLTVWRIAKARKWLA